MNYYKRRNNPPLWLWLLCAVAVIATVLVICFAEFPEGPGGPGMDSTDPPAVENDPSGDSGDGLIATETPYGTLYFPKTWEEFLRIDVQEGASYTLTYLADLGSGKTQELFAISFGGSMDSAVGTVTAGGKTVAVNLSVSEFVPGEDWTDEEVNTVYAMQEGLNQVMESLDLQPVGDAVQTGDDAMTIETPYGDLRYPAKWKDLLDLEMSDAEGYTVTFRAALEGHEPVFLFAVHYANGKGIAVGTVTDSSGSTVDVGLEIQELALDGSWSDSDRLTVAAMQEDLNFLLSELN